jgi:hypothetical protein
VTDPGSREAVEIAADRTGRGPAGARPARCQRFGRALRQPQQIEQPCLRAAHQTFTYEWQTPIAALSWMTQKFKQFTTAAKAPSPT